MTPRELKRHKILTGDAKSLLRHPSPSARGKFSSYFRNHGRDSPENEYLLRNLSTHSAPRSIANITWRDRKALSRLQPSKVDRKDHLSPAELALAFFSKVEKLRSRRKSSLRQPPCHCAKCWSQSLPVTSSRKKHFSSRQSSSPGSSCTDILSQTSSCTGRSWQSEPAMPSPRLRYSLLGQGSRSQCCCGSQGRAGTKDCEFCCALNCAMVKAANSKEAGFEAVDFARSHGRIARVDGKSKCRSTSNCKLSRLRVDDYFSTRSAEKIIVPGFKNTGVCTESESKQNVLRDSRRVAMTDQRRGCGLEIVDCKSNGSFRENCAEKVVYKGDDTPYGYNVHDKALVGRTREPHKRNVHDAATGNVRDFLRRIYHDKAVGSDRDISGCDHRDLHRDNARNVSRHNLHQDKAVGSVRDLSRHVYYERDVENSRENSNERRVLNANENSGLDMSPRDACHVRDHSADRVMLEIARKKARDKTADDEIRDRVNDKLKIKARDKMNVKDWTRDEITRNAKFSCHENSDSGSCGVLQSRRRAKEHHLTKRNDGSKMSFVLGDKPRHFPSGVSDRSVPSDTSSSIRDCSRRRGHVSRKK